MKLHAKTILRYKENRLNVHLLFGDPATYEDIHFEYGSSEKHVFFAPGSLFALELWAANEYGTVKWMIYILRAVGPGEKASRVPQVMPGAEILLHVRGKKKVQLVRTWINGLRESGHNLTEIDRYYYQASHYKFKNGLRPRELEKPYGKVIDVVKHYV